MYPRELSRAMAGPYGLLHSPKHRLPLITPAFAVEGVLYRSQRVLLIRRRSPPFVKRWALPGGFVEIGETAEGAVVREVREETGIEAYPVQLLGVFSAPQRDPRGHTVAAAYLMEARSGKPCGGSETIEVRWWPVRELPNLAFDHLRIVQTMLKLVALAHHGKVGPKLPEPRAHGAKHSLSGRRRDRVQVSRDSAKVLSKGRSTEGMARGH
jgi:8-oxo-dGTP diphosphatase